MPLTNVVASLAWFFLLRRVNGPSFLPHVLFANQASGTAYERGPKPVCIKYGLNHVTALIEAKKASLVVIAHDVEPVEVLYSASSDLPG